MVCSFPYTLNLRCISIMGFPQYSDTCVRLSNCFDFKVSVAISNRAQRTVERLIHRSDFNKTSSLSSTSTGIRTDTNFDFLICITKLKLGWYQKCITFSRIKNGGMLLMGDHTPSRHYGGSPAPVSLDGMAVISTGESGSP